MLAPPARLVPGDYRVTAVSTNQRKAVGYLRLWRASAADSGWSEYAKRVIRVAPDDTVRHPLIGVTTIWFLGTEVYTDSSLVELQQATNPLYPGVLVNRAVDQMTGAVRLWLLTGEAERDPGIVILDGAGSILEVTEVRGDGFRGTYGRYGIVGTDHDTGHFWAVRISPS